MTSKYLKEFEELNTTTDSIYDLGDYEVLIILKDGTNLTSWDDVSKKLKDLREHELVYVLNLEYHVPKLYRLTERGRKILKLLE